ncbi:MAG: hypothetical protein LBN97_00055, partial [Oscillospiraceae bacterium]|nr:hypothetical protein [Oscillospiraceae bacterium]
MTNILFGTNRQFNLERLPFSSEGAFLSIYQDFEDKKLYFTICRSEGGSLQRSKLLSISLLYNGEELPFIYECDAAKLTVSTKFGSAEFTYETSDIMRVRVKGITLKIHFEPEMHEGGVERAIGEVELGFNLLGKLLFKHIAGKMTNNAKWNFRQVSPFPMDIELSPEGDIPGEWAIHEYYTNITAKKAYLPFDEAYAQTLAKFEQFCANYPQVPLQYRDMAEQAMWLVWSSRLGPEGGHGGLRDTVVYMHKLYLNRAFGWQQCYHAIATSENASEAWRLLLSFFDYQDSAGGVPDNISDLNQYVWLSTKPPLYGFACCYILDNFDVSCLTENDFAHAYDKLTKFTRFWFTHHDHARTGFPAYYHVNESGYDESALFDGGLPIQTPDLQAYIVKLCEACSRLAAKLGDTNAAEHWAAEAKRVLAYLTDELWDGEKFRAKLTTTGEYYACGSLAMLQPAMLGSLLPKEVLHKLALRASDPTEFLTDFGMATENLQSPQLMMRSFTRGPVIAPTQILILLGLYEGGEVEIAREICAKYLNALL